MKYIKLIGSGLLLMGMSGSLVAAEFWRTGTVERIITGATLYGGCMLLLSRRIANGCPNNGWVSLDCAHTYSSESSTKNKYALVLTALVTNKKISIKVDNSKKIDNYCVVKRIDLIR
jgi:hypothetical protein